jgi:hypothetical protein
MLIFRMYLHVASWRIPNVYGVYPTRRAMNEDKFITLAVITTDQLTGVEVLSSTLRIQVMMAINGDARFSLTFFFYTR